MPILTVEVKATEIEEVAQFFESLYDVLTENHLGDRSSWIEQFDKVTNLYNEFADKHEMIK